MRKIANRNSKTQKRKLDFVESMSDYRSEQPTMTALYGDMRGHNQEIESSDKKSEMSIEDAERLMQLREPRVGIRLERPEAKVMIAIKTNENTEDIPLNNSVDTTTGQENKYFSDEEGANQVALTENAKQESTGELDEAQEFNKDAHSNLNETVAVECVNNEEINTAGMEDIKKGESLSTTRSKSPTNKAQQNEMELAKCDIISGATLPTETESPSDSNSITVVDKIYSGYSDGDLLETSGHVVPRAIGFADGNITNSVIVSGESGVDQHEDEQSLLKNPDKEVDCIIISSSEEDKEEEDAKPSFIDSVFPYDDYHDCFRRRSASPVTEVNRAEAEERDKKKDIKTALQELYEKSFAEPSVIALSSDDDDSDNNECAQQLIISAPTPDLVNPSLSSNESSLDISPPKNEDMLTDNEKRSETVIEDDDDNEFLCIVRLPKTPVPRKRRRLLYD